MYHAERKDAIVTRVLDAMAHQQAHFARSRSRTLGAFGISLLALVVSATLAACGGGPSNSGGGNPSANPISFVQSAGTSGGCTQVNGCDSQSLSMPKPVSNGDFIAVVFWWNGGNTNGSEGITVTDSANNTYTSIGPTTNFSCGDSTLCYGFYATNVNGGSNFTVTASRTGTNGYGFYMAAVEVKGATTFDFWKGGGCSVQGGCTIYATDQFELAHADELLVGVASLQPESGPISQFTIQAGPDFTEVYTQDYFAAEYLVTTTPGQYEGQFMSNTVGTGSVIFAAFY